MMDQVIGPILLDSAIARQFPLASLHRLSRADEEAWRTYCQRLVASGAILSAMDPNAAVEFGGLIQYALRSHFISELELTGPDVFALDNALSVLQWACELQSHAVPTPSSGSKRAAAAYSKVIVVAQRSRQAAISQISRLLERCARRALPVVATVVKEIPDRPTDPQLPDEAA